jgi:hypothetical protein
MAGMKSCIAVAALMLAAACDAKEQQAAAPSPAASGSPAAEASGAVQTASASKSGIDWEAARTARAEATRGDQVVTAQQAPGGPPPAVPILLPSNIVRAANAGPPVIRKTEDGYFATYETPKYDATVNGTNVSYAAGGQPSDKAVKEALKFTVGEGEATLSFSRFGADYLITFECKEIDQGASCITEEEAKEFADGLFVAQTQ